jgi:hypothetical protein
MTNLVLTIGSYSIANIANVVYATKPVNISRDDSWLQMFPAYNNA